MASTRLLPALLLVVTAASGQVDLQNLLSNSPFGQGRTAGAPEAGGTWEFRGVAEESGEVWFSLFDPATKRSTWVRQGETGPGPVVRGYDAAAPSITIEYQSRTVTLPLRRAPQVSTAMAGPTPLPNAPGGPGPAPQPAGNPAVGAPAGTNLDAQRMQQFAEEIRRRRALRQQAVQRGTPPPSSGNR